MLTEKLIQDNLSIIGINPLTRKYSFLQLNVSEKNLESLDLLMKYTQLIYLDISKNQITDLSSLSSLPSLTQLIASENKIRDCLFFQTPLCSMSNAWNSGHHSIGSMLTMVDLGHNLIESIGDLSHHPFLECLLLNNNLISKVQGIQSLKYLKVLDLSHNQLTRIEGLEGLPLQELNLSHNRLTTLEGVALSELPRLSSLHLRGNALSSLGPLAALSALACLDASHNRLKSIRQVEFLSHLPWLTSVLLQGNPCSRKHLYRLRVTYRLPALRTLDEFCVSPEERIRALNLYGVEGGDLRVRASVFSRLLPQLYRPCSPEDCEQDQEGQTQNPIQWEAFQDEEFLFSPQELYEGREGEEVEIGLEREGQIAREEGGREVNMEGEFRHTVET